MISGGAKFSSDLKRAIDEEDSNAGALLNVSCGTEELMGIAGGADEGAGDEEEGAEKKSSKESVTFCGGAGIVLEAIGPTESPSVASREVAVREIVGLNAA